MSPSYFPNFTVCRGKQIRFSSAIINSTEYENANSYEDDDDSETYDRQRARRQERKERIRQKREARRKKNQQTQIEKDEDANRTKRRQQNEMQIKREMYTTEVAVNTADKYTDMETEQLEQKEQQINQSTTDGTKLDIIIFGATGSLGAYTVLHAVSVLSNYKWGIAGRNRIDLLKVLRNVSSMTNKKTSGIPIFLADADNKRSLRNLAAECHVLINCVAPYERYASAVIEACIAVGTNYVDACIETAFINKLYEDFHDKAEQQNVYVINSCGFISFAVDVGINFLVDNFKGQIYTVEAYTQFYQTDKQRSLPFMSCAAFQSLVASMANSNLVVPLNFDFYTMTNLNKLTYGTPIRTSDAVDGVCISMPFIEAETVQRTQEYLSFVEQRPTIKFKNFLTFPSYIMAVLALIWFVLLFILAQAPGTRSLVLRFPQVFSFGMCAGDYLEKDSLDKLLFNVTLKATGSATDERRTKNSNNSNNNKCAGVTPSAAYVEQEMVDNKPMNMYMTAKMCGSNPLYGFGCIALLCSAKTILKETSALPEVGGVYTPGAAFRRTEILQKICSENSKYKYKVCEPKS